MEKQPHHAMRLLSSTKERSANSSNLAPSSGDTTARTTADGTCEI